MTYVTIHKDQLEELLAAAKMRYEVLKDQHWCSAALDCAVDEAEHAIKSGADPAITAARINFQGALLNAEISSMIAVNSNRQTCGGDLAYDEVHFSQVSMAHEAIVQKILRGEA